MVGIGANVIRHVEADTTVAGNPAKPLVPRG
jgi:acetyltransferase-like isoleucine patch superfamily enzyme